MKLEFDLGNVSVTEFGVGRDDGTGEGFVAVPVGVDVQAALHEIVHATWGAMQAEGNAAARYEPSEKHSSLEYLYLPVADDLSAPLRELHQAVNLPIDVEVLSEPSEVFCYFARLTDKKQRHLTALRRATQFKGILKSRNRLVRMRNDTLRILGDTVFKLDSDFDLLIDDSTVHILRPSGFEFVGKLQQAILHAVPENIAAIRKDLKFVEFDGIEGYAATHPRAARYLASIRGQEETRNIDKSLLKRLCKQTGVDVKESKRKLSVAVGHEMGFLEVLDRRRYEVSLVPERPERYRAASRSKLEG